METFNINNGSSQFYIQVKVDTIKKAFTKVYYLVREERIKPHLAVSEIYENGSIDLDSQGDIQWKYIDVAGKFIGHEFEFITIIDNLPVNCKTDEKAKDYILENVKIKYKLKEEDNIKEFDLQESDKIKLLIERTGIIYKKIKLQ